MNLERKALLTALERVKPALATSGSIPALKHVWFTGTQLQAYNGAMGVRVPFSLQADPCGVPGAVLAGLLSSTDADSVDLDFRETELVLKVGKATTTVALMVADQDPWAFPDRPPKGALSLTLSEEVRAGLSAASVVRCTNPVRVEHYGVTLFPSKDMVSFYATDSKVLAEVQVKARLSKDLQRLVLPHAYVQQLLTLKVGSEVHFTDDSILAESEKVQVCSNLLDSGDVYDLPALVEETLGGDEEPIPFPAGLGEGLNRGLVLAGSASAESYVTLSHAKKEIKLAGKLHYGSLAESFETKRALPAAKITVGLEHLKGLMRRASSFAITPKALALYGVEGTTYLIAAHEA